MTKEFIKEMHHYKIKLHLNFQLNTNTIFLISITILFFNPKLDHYFKQDF
jgi:hypothetical protein